MTLQARKRLLVISTLTATLLAAALLRLYQLGGRSLWMDEYASWRQSKDGLSVLISRTSMDNYPPLHNFSLAAVMATIGDSEWALRLPSVVFGVLCVGALYVLGRLLFSEKTALLGAAALSLAPFHIWHSQEARMYALLTLTATLYAVASVLFVRQPKLVRAAFVSLTAAALLYTHPFGPVNWLAIGGACTVVYARSLGARALLGWVTANAIAALAFAPWGWILLQRAAVVTSSVFSVPDATPEYVTEQILAIAGGPLCALTFAIGLILAILPPLRRETLLLWTWAILPPLIALAVSLVTTPVFLGRYLIGALPPVALLAAFGITRYLSAVPAAVAGAAMVVVLAIGLWGEPGVAKPDVRSAAALIDDGPGTCVIMIPSWIRWPLEYYKRDGLICAYAIDRPGDLIDVEGGTVYLDTAKRVLLITASGTDSDGELDMLRQAGWEVAADYSFIGIDVHDLVRGPPP